MIVLIMISRRNAVQNNDNNKYAENDDNNDGNNKHNKRLRICDKKTEINNQMQRNDMR